ncbi:hypothetical protein TrRE_jg5333 [Triparma retinervis]|uniref:CS domain-containing protein n=1 Tax=Triparma retinervis TaxID=2557542 RepID=A0A9W7DZV4_9STRA|nr:hypothetical protein TrRE_jg5333 [Triparma retinervis]
MPNTAPIKWAQRSDAVFLTISVTDLKDEKITLSNDKLVFTAKSGDSDYTSDITFFAACDADKSTYKVLPRSIQFHMVKEKQEEEFWPRLLKDKMMAKMKTDLEGKKGEGEEEPDSDDDDLPDLEES